MDNKKIPTMLGTIVIIIIAVTVGVLVWKYEEIKYQDEIQSQGTIVIRSQAQRETRAITPTYQDKHGCVNPSGYFWCEEKQSCLQNWNESCGVSDILDTSKWDNFTSNDKDSKFSFSFKFPRPWFNPYDSGGESFMVIPFYSKNEYSKKCYEDKEIKGKMTCKENGNVALISISTSKLIEREVRYDNKKTSPVIVDNYKGFIADGIVNDSAGGYLVDNGQREIMLSVQNIKGMHFKIIMKINNDSDKDIFYKIVSTIKFSF